MNNDKDLKNKDIKTTTENTDVKKDDSEINLEELDTVTGGTDKKVNISHNIRNR